ncbi:glycosyltransferase [Cereibacter sphaeroides]|nr:glycosyltransferase [Cereibacter sphaeroides]
MAGTVDQTTATEPTPGRLPLGTLLLRRGAIRAGDLVRALEIQSRQQSRLGDILRAHGLASDEDVIAALAEQFGTMVIDAEASRPDPRLIDRLGPRRCLQLACLPWARRGAVTLVACARPDSFDDHRPELEACLGPVAMAVIPEAALHRALLASRRSTLRLMAETCVAVEESCRIWDSRRFSRWMASAALGIVAATLVAPMMTFLLLFGIILTFLLAGNLMKLAAAIAQLRARRRRPVDGPTLPLRKPPVSIMVPLYREPDIAPRLVRRLGAISYPRELLDVMLVVEEDDHLTRDALAASKLPEWMRVIPVPDSTLRTKPRALNYVLNFARGQIVGVYDAEDAPAPDQLHRVIEAFAAGGPKLACVQGVLDYVNPSTNWLSRCFTIEYAAWFRLILPGLARLGLVVPLGGTTLFFRRDLLEKLGGWDAHNVTEDADLGLRLARHGYRTELVSSVTMEEANCRVWPWIKQRSRWLKGYAMTYAVHMRDPGLLWRQLGAWRFFGVQLLFLGTLVQFLLAPILWSFWLMLFGLGHPLARAMPGIVPVTIAVIFLSGEVISLTINIAALQAPRHKFLRIWTPSLHFYFPLAAIAAWKGIWELVVSPFYWDKTTHGLHDGKSLAAHA